MPKEKTIILQIKVNEKDYKYLTRHGFLMEKNINEILQEIAEDLRDANKK